MRGNRSTIKFISLMFFILFISLRLNSQSREEVYKNLKSLGNGSYLFGQMATWVHNENPDMDNPGNWLKKIYDHTGKLPKYGCITYDFVDDPFTDAEWNNGVKKIWNAGMIAGVYNFYANPSGGKWNGPVTIDPIFDSGDNAIKTNFYKQMDRMVVNLQWMKDNGIPVVYTPFVELNDKNKWHAKEGSKNAIRLYRLVHDYFTAKGLDNIIWAYHTTQGEGALIEYYPGDEYVDVIGKSAYGTGLIFTEYDWAVDKKKTQGKVIWWGELGIRGQNDPPVDCFKVLEKLENSFPELAGFVFWSDDKYYNVTGNLNGPQFMADPKIVTLKSAGPGLSVGDNAPEFKAKADDGSTWDIKKFLGKNYIVVYFYPGAMTGGCTKQACSYRDKREELKSTGVEVVGVSGDKVENLRLFKIAENLNFTLLSDEKGDIAKIFGVPIGEGGSIKRTVNGTEHVLTREISEKRWTFVIGKDKKIIYKNESVNPEKDTEEVLNFLKLQASNP